MSIASGLTPGITPGIITDMNDSSDKTRENRLRRMATRQGLMLQKSRARDPRSITYGTYWLLDAATNTIAAGDTNHGYGMSLDEIEKALNED